SQPTGRRQSTSRKNQASPPHTQFAVLNRWVAPADGKTAASTTSSTAASGPAGGVPPRNSRTPAAAPTAAATTQPAATTPGASRSADMRPLQPDPVAGTSGGGHLRPTAHTGHPAAHRLAQPVPVGRHGGRVEARTVVGDLDHHEVTGPRQVHRDRRARGVPD